MKISIEGQVTLLQSMTLTDAEDIIALRNQPHINRYLSSSDVISVEEQINWMKNNEAKQDSLYLKIIDKSNNNFCGTASIYQINNKDRSAEFGRYICIKSLQAIESELLLIQFVFEVMRLKSIYCRTAELNTKVWEQHYGFGFTDNGTELLTEKQLYLKKQILTIESYRNFDYSKIENLINRLVL
jgi:RimJ/RimL family protein N-acetyltransferase